MNAAKAAATKGAAAAAATGGAKGAAAGKGGAAAAAASGPAAAAALAAAAAAAHADAVVRSHSIMKEAEILRLTSSVPPLVLHPQTLMMTLPPGTQLPDRPPVGGTGPRVLRKRLRLHPHWKLAPVRKWINLAPFVKTIRITYDPSTEGYTGARELGRQVYSSKARRLFPKYTVEVEETHGGEAAFVTIKMTNDKTFVVPAQWSTFNEILDKFENERQALEWAEDDLEMT